MSRLLMRYYVTVGSQLLPLHIVLQNTEIDGNAYLATTSGDGKFCVFIVFIHRYDQG